MTKPIPLDSDLWVKDLWGGVDDPRPELRELVAADKPTSKSVEDLLDGLYYVDFPAPQFFFAIPYLIEIFESDTANQIPAINQFCQYMHKCKEGKPQQKYLNHFESNRKRIFDLLVKCISLSDGKGYYVHKELIAGLATACGESDLGRQIIGLSSDTPIN